MNPEFDADQHLKKIRPDRTRSRVLFWVIYSVVLVTLTAWITHQFDNRQEYKRRGSSPNVVSGPWGDLMAYDVRVEQAREYAGFEQISVGLPEWFFGGMSIEDVRKAMQQAGMSQEQIKTATDPKNIQLKEGGLVVTADEMLVCSLSAEVRSSLYSTLAAYSENRTIASPYFIPEGDVTKLLIGDKEDTGEIRQLVKSLLYQRNGFWYFSDDRIVFRHLKTEEGRFDFYRSLTGQNAVIARILVRPNADVDKAIHYWGLPVAGVRVKDLRPLMEAEQRLPEGGSLSILYFLPPMARERLYTSPLPSGTAKGLPDCHWTALNFFNNQPDDRLSDLNVASQVVAENYYQIATPGIYGDLVLILNSKGHVVHSAVYLADDIVFTKNGMNYAVPWILMRTKNLLGTYSATDSCRAIYFRRKNM